MLVAPLETVPTVPEADTPFRARLVISLETVPTAPEAEPPERVTAMV
jgi:hypothetical protein